MADVKWIKITTDMFDDEKIKVIENMPDGDSVLVIWLRLLILAGRCNNNGIISFTKDMPYTEKMLSQIFRMSEHTIKYAIETVTRYNMVTINNDGFLEIINWDKHQNTTRMNIIKEQTKLRVKRYREHNKALSYDNCNADVTQGVTQEKRNRSKKIEVRSKKIEKVLNTICPFDEFWMIYPKRVAKSDAVKAWEKIKMTDDLFIKILKVLDHQCKSFEWTKQNGKFVPYPATWLNGKRWEDEILLDEIDVLQKMYQEENHDETGND